jgi:hypothetical protein
VTIFFQKFQTTEQLDTPEKISEILVNAYPQANYMEFAETMTDNVFDSGDLTHDYKKQSKLQLGNATRH